jgi:hypothetical protein
MTHDNVQPVANKHFLPIGTLQHLRWLYQITKCILVLNLLDAFCTLFWVGAGFAEEGNILLRNLVNHHPILFVLVKAALVSLGSLLLWRYRHHALAVMGLFTVFLVYYCLLLYHLRFSNLLVQYLLDG